MLVVVYFRFCYKGEISVFFIMGKVKLVFFKGYIIFCLEFCVVLLVIEVGEFIRKNL